MNWKDDGSSRDAHVDELLSGYLDEELTQQQRQRVELHMADCSNCRARFTELRELRIRMGESRLSGVDTDVWRETMGDRAVKASRGIGWLLFLGGILLLAGYGIYQFVIDTSTELVVKLMVAAVYLGLGALFVSVLRQRLIERKSDRYKDVEI